jgi:hypothetical protein
MLHPSSETETPANSLAAHTAPPPKNRFRVLRRITPARRTVVLRYGQTAEGMNGSPNLGILRSKIRRFFTPIFSLKLFISKVLN